jgi:predicted DCC family thiol-disulfide oxidoreductase YuxK
MADLAPSGSPVAGRPVILFDGVCNLCNRSVQFVLGHDRRARFLLAANQSEAGRRRLAAHGFDGEIPQTIYLVEGGRLYRESTAVLRIARGLGFPWSLAWAAILVPRFLRDAVYHFVARNRYRWFGRREQCRLPQPGEKERFLE